MEKITKTYLRKRKKVYLLDMFRELHPFRSNFYYRIFTKEELIKHICSDLGVKY